MAGVISCLLQVPSLVPQALVSFNCGAEYEKRVAHSRPHSSPRDLLLSLFLFQFQAKNLIHLEIPSTKSVRFPSYLVSYSLHSTTRADAWKHPELTTDLRSFVLLRLSAWAISLAIYTPHHRDIAVSETLL